MEPWREKLDTLPASPGVYVFRGDEDKVLYVGKARSLRSRVRSYFQAGSSDVRAFVFRLERELIDIETFVVGTEKEAALLEHQLIKQHRPRYNVKLRDDKEFLSLRLDPKGKWPRLEVVRRPKADGAHYFGPYDSATAARRTLRLVNRHFQLRTCSDAELASRARPCLQYQIKRCQGPCVFEVPTAQYAQQVRNVALFLDGRHDELVDELASKMREAAGKLEYELAATYRDQLQAVERVREDQRISAVRDVDQDALGLFREAERVEVAVIGVRRGKVTTVRTYPLRNVTLPDEEVVSSFLSEYYDDGSYVPDEVLLPCEIEARDGLAEALGETRGSKVGVLVPKRGDRRKLVEMAIDNAAHAFREKAREREDAESRLGEVQRRLRLDRLPRRIECVDISHEHGRDTVAVFAALENGARDPKRYRSFRVRHVGGGDDYGAMHEVIARRVRRGRDGDERFALPDLLVVDGGRGQLGVALAVLRDLGVVELPVVALAKEKESLAGDKLVDRVYLPGQKNPLPLRESSPALQMLALARDEAHRASNAFREKLGKKRRFTSDLDAIHGVGQKTRGVLLRSFGSVRGIRSASDEALREAGATTRQIAAIRGAFAPGPRESTIADVTTALRGSNEPGLDRPTRTDVDDPTARPPAAGED